MPHIVAVSSLKGGVGKTSVTLGLVSAALEAQIPVTVVDLDPQADTSLSLSVLQQDPATSSSRFLAQPDAETLKSLLQPGSWSPGLLQVVPGGMQAVNRGVPEPAAENIAAVRAALKSLPDQSAELILIDCPPALDAETVYGIGVSDRVLLVTEPGLFSVNAVSRGLRAIADIRSNLAPQVQPLGVVVNRHKTRALEQGYRIDELRRLFGPLILSPVLYERAALQQAQGAGVPVHEWPSRAARELSHGFDAILSRIRRTMP